MFISSGVTSVMKCLTLTETREEERKKKKKVAKIIIVRTNGKVRKGAPKKESPKRKC